VKQKRQKHTTGGIPRWSPTLVLVARFSAYVWQSGRDAQFSLTYGRMYKVVANAIYVRKIIASSDISVKDRRQQHESMTAYGSDIQKRPCPSVTIVLLR
jgi:hypothetical protein